MAREQLQATGISGEAIHIESPTTETSIDVQPTARRGFFAQLFGLGDKDEVGANYAEAVRRGSVVLSVEADESRAEALTGVLEDCGAIDIEQRVAQWKAAGYTGYDDHAPAYTPDQIAQEHEALQVVEEDLKVGKRTVARGGVRVMRRVTERPVEEQVVLRDERAVVDRMAVNRPASEDELHNAFRDETIELRETAEEAVVSKTARVVEEVHVGTETTERTETIRDTVRRSDVDVQKVAQNASPASPAAARTAAPDQDLFISESVTPTGRLP